MITLFRKAYFSPANYVAARNDKNPQLICLSLCHFDDRRNITFISLASHLPQKRVPNILSMYSFIYLLLVACALFLPCIVFGMIETMLTKKKFKDFFQKNIAAL